MEYLTFSKEEVLEKLKDNREKYVEGLDLIFEEYEKKIEEYQTDYKEYSEKHLDMVKSGEKEDIEPPPEPIKPNDYTSVYDNHVSFLENSNDEMIQLTLNEYNQLFLDKWSFKQRFRDTVKWYATSSPSNTKIQSLSAGLAST